MNSSATGKVLPKQKEDQLLMENDNQQHLRINRF
jgi:hypothetical protein